MSFLFAAHKIPTFVMLSFGLDLVILMGELVSVASPINFNWPVFINVLFNLVFGAPNVVKF